MFVLDGAWQSINRGFLAASLADGAVGRDPTGGPLAMSYG
jgi:hypothetical protein